MDSGGNLLALDHPTGWAAWWGAVQSVFFPLLGACWLASVAGQVVSYRRSSGERRLQLKWLIGGSAIAAAGGLLAVPFSNSPDRALHIGGSLALLAVLALPLSMGVAILKYRLYDIDRIISAGPWPTRSSPGCWSACTRGWCCWPRRCCGSPRRWRWPRPRWPRRPCSRPLRRRVQRAVDRRFNRARYDADQTVARFAARLKDAVDLGSVRADLQVTVSASLQPAHVSVWVPERQP